MALFLWVTTQYHKNQYLEQNAIPTAYNYIEHEWIFFYFHFDPGCVVLYGRPKSAAIDPISETLRSLRPPPSSQYTMGNERLKSGLD